MNAELDKAKRWTIFRKLDAQDYYCRQTLLKFVDKGRPDPVKLKHCFKRYNNHECKNCSKCKEIAERNKRNGN